MTVHAEQSTVPPMATSALEQTPACSSLHGRVSTGAHAEVERDLGARAPAPAWWRDFVTLSKPGITTFCLIMTAGGAGAAWALPGLRAETASLAGVLWAMLGTALSVAGANAMNMWMEREGDRKMRRTRSRPLPAGRMKPAVAFAYGATLGVVSTALLYAQVNAVTAGLSAFAFLSYVLVYTPMKRMSAAALFVGAVPGAMPPLLGWTAVTGVLSAPGLALFAILFVWQMPHFIAISIYRQRDYDEAGILVFPSTRGMERAKTQALVWSILLVASSLMLVVLGVAGTLYMAVALAVGGWFFVWSMRGYEPGAGNAWARSFFLASLVYLPVLTLALVLDMALFGSLWFARVG